MLISCRLVFFCTRLILNIISPYPAIKARLRIMGVIHTQYVTQYIMLLVESINIHCSLFCILIRLWLKPLVDPEDETQRDCITLGVRDFHPDVTSYKQLENLDLRSVVRRVNSQLWESPIAGQ